MFSARSAWVFVLVAGLGILACGEKHDPFFEEDPTFTIEVTADPPTSLRDDETYGYWSFPASVRFEGVPLLSLSRGDCLSKSSIMLASISRSEALVGSTGFCRVICQAGAGHPQSDQQIPPP